jgi:hypothetical protein
MTSSKLRSCFTVSTVVLLLTSCALFSRRVNLGEEFTMKPGEKVGVAGSGLAIKLEGVGHQTSANPKAQIRASYVTLKVSPGPTEPVRVEDSVDVGDYSITVKSANPFNSDGGPSCALVVTRR